MNIPQLLNRKVAIQKKIIRLSGNIDEVQKLLHELSDIERQLYKQS